MAATRVVLLAPNFSDSELAAALQAAAREVGAVHVHGLEPARLPALRRAAGRGGRRALRPPAPLTGRVILIPGPHEFAAGALRRLLARWPGVEVVRVYVPGGDPTRAVTRFSPAAIGAAGGRIENLPDYRGDEAGRGGRHRMWVRGDELGIYHRRPGGWLGVGARLAVGDMWRRAVRAPAGRARRALRARAGRATGRSRGAGFGSGSRPR